MGVLGPWKRKCLLNAAPEGQLIFVCGGVLSQLLHEGALPSIYFFAHICYFCTVVSKKKKKKLVVM